MRDDNSPEAYTYLIRSICAPNKTVADNAMVLIGSKWSNTNRKYCIETGLTVPHYQHQNYYEGVGSDFKILSLKLFHNVPHALILYLCYAACFLDKTRLFLSQSTLDGRCGYEMIKGITGYIHIFRFSWFEHIWFYNPAVSFTMDKMEPGFFLDLADNTGNGFSYEILSVLLYKDIPRCCNPVTLIQPVIIPHCLVILNDVPMCVES